MSYFSYWPKEGGEVTLGSASWTLEGWLRASQRRPGIRPCGRYILLLQDPEPLCSGLIYLPEGALEDASKVSTVLAIPMERGRPGFFVERALLSGKKAVSHEKVQGSSRAFVSVDLVPGDRVVCSRFAGVEGLTDELHHNRLRLVDYFNIYGKVEP